MPRGLAEAVEKNSGGKDYYGKFNQNKLQLAELCRGGSIAVQDSEKRYER